MGYSTRARSLAGQATALAVKFASHLINTLYSARVIHSSYLTNSVVAENERVVTK